MMTLFFAKLLNCNITLFIYCVRVTISGIPMKSIYEDGIGSFDQDSDGRISFDEIPDVQFVFK